MELGNFKRIFIGEPFPTSRESHERLDKIRGLAVFASDPISSNAYATEAIMHVLIVLGSGALAMTLPIGLGVALLVLMVVFSYIQTIMHYPDGGGAYTVAKDNLGEKPALLAAAALLVDYVLTVSVSVAAGVRAVTSAFPEMHDYRVLIALLAIVLITWLNLRGVRESGTIFAIPTYAFIAGVLLTIMVGLVRYFGIFGAAPIFQTAETIAPSVSLTGFAYVWLLLRAFSGGCTALTGIEAISNGVKAFKCPEPRNAARTMVAMGIVAMTLFVGILFLSTHLTLIPNKSESILSQLTRKATGTGFIYYWVQIFTAGILFMAANTGYQDFPRLSYFLAQDNYLPRWLKNRGDRLVFSAGILTLAVVSSLLILIFQADEIAMLPLYAIGVMLCFSLSQAGMFKLMGRISHLKKGETLETQVTVVHYEKGVKWKRVMNAMGSLVTFSVFLVLVLTKFLEGAWIVALLIPALVYTFYSIKNHYAHVSKTLSTRALEPTNLIGVANVVIVPIADIHMGSLRAIQYAKRLSDDVRVVTISTGIDDKQQFMQHWNRFPQVIEGTKLELVDYDYRDVLTPIVNYIKRVNKIEFPHEITTVVIPEFISERFLARFLHNQTASRLRSLLRNYRDIVIIEVPFHIDS